jgi:hypothetical protein
MGTPPTTRSTTPLNVDIFAPTESRTHNVDATEVLVITKLHALSQTHVITHSIVSLEENVGRANHSVINTIYSLSFKKKVHLAFTFVQQRVFI